MMHRPVVSNSCGHRGLRRPLVTSAVPCSGATRRPLTTAAATAACVSSMRAPMQTQVLQLRQLGGAMHLIKAAGVQRGSVIAHARRKAQPAQEPESSGAAGVKEAEQDEEEELMDEEDQFDYEAELEAMTDVDMANSVFGIPGMVEFSHGENDLPRVFLKHLYSESGAEIYLHGATVTQWLRPDGNDGLALRPDADFRGEAPIESGVGIFFPQYRSGGVLDKGFANAMQWQLVAAGLDFLEFGDGFTEPHQYDDEGASPSTAGAGPSSSSSSSSGSSSNGGVGAGASSSSGSQAGGGASSSGAEGGAAAAAGAGEQAEPDVSAQADADASAGPEDGEGDSDDVATQGLDEGTALMKRRMDMGLDPAPFVTLRLTDTEATRELWPHKFEVLYKITLMETDDFEDLTPGADQETLSSESSPVMMSAAMETKAALVKNVDMLEDGDLELDPNVYHDPRLMPSAIDKNEDFAIPLEDQPRKSSPEERLLGVRDSSADQHDVPLQLRLEVKVFNRDPQGSAPMEFQAGHLAHIATRDQRWHGDFVKVRGLGGANVLDYTEDRTPVVSLCQEDYINFWGQRVDATFVNVTDADVAFTPGDGTHFELLAREGHRDVMLYHPGVLPGSTVEDTEAARTWVGLGAGRIITPIKLAPGEQWYSCFKLRFHNRVWKAPVFGEDGMYPLDPIPQAMLESAEDADAGAEDGGLDGGLDTPDDEPGMV